MKFYDVIHERVKYLHSIRLSAHSIITDFAKLLNGSILGNARKLDKIVTYLVILLKTYHNRTFLSLHLAALMLSARTTGQSPIFSVQSRTSTSKETEVIQKHKC